MTQTTPTPKKKQRSWWHKRHIVLALCVVIGLILVVLVQLLYPTGKALPVAWIGKTQVGGQTFEQAVETIRHEYASVPVTLEVANKAPYRTTSSEAGIVPGYRHAAEAVTQYSLSARLVPFSFAYKMLQRQSVGYEIDAMNFKRFATDFAAYCQVQPKDASLVFENGSVRLDKAQAGQQCDTEAIRRVVTNTELRPEGVTITLSPKTVEPKVTDKKLQKQFSAATETIKAGVTIRTSKDVWRVPAETIASWMTTEQQGDTIVLAVKTEAVKDYLETLRGSLYIAPGTINASFVDGMETSRTTGARGQGVDVDVTAERVKTVLLDSPTADRTAWVQLTVIEPVVIAKRSYTATQQGLQALLEQWDRENPARYGLMVLDLSGKGMSASLNPDRDFVTASTFKVFLAYAVLHKVETGELSLDTKTDTGLTARSCIDEMIVHSTNVCAVSLFELAGWSYVHNFIRGQFPNTSLMNALNTDYEKHTTPRDVTSFMHKLNAGTLMNATNTNYLLDLMKRQIYRAGIPKGVAGVTVADKVGFYNGYKHDAGLVYSPRGTYVMTFLSFGGSDPQIADLSRKVYELVSRN